MTLLIFLKYSIPQNSQKSFNLRYAKIKKNIEFMIVSKGNSPITTP